MDTLITVSTDEKTRLAQLQEGYVNRLNHRHQRPVDSHLIVLGFILEGEDENSESWEGSSHINQLKFGDQWSHGSLVVPNSELGLWSDRRSGHRLWLIAMQSL